jgi:hypothetical protein
MAAYARWVHDVLLVHKGLALVRTLPLPIAAAERPVEKADPQEIKRVRDNPILLQFGLDDGATKQLATSGEARSLAYGPYEEQFTGNESQAESIGQAQAANGQARVCIRIWKERCLFTVKLIAGD